MSQPDPSATTSAAPPPVAPKPQASAPASAPEPDATVVLRVVAGTDTFTYTLNDGEGDVVTINRTGVEVPKADANDILDTAALVGVQLAVGALPSTSARREYTFNEDEPSKPTLVGSEDANA